MTEPKRKNFYPTKRRKARRSKDSYRCNDPIGRAHQLANLEKGRSRRNRRAQAGILATRAKVTAKDLEGMDIITFSTEVLNVSFRERPAQEVILRAQYGLPLDAGQLEMYGELTKGQKYRPGYERTEGIYVLGARSGKSFLASIIAIYESTVRAPRFRKYLNSGEVGYVIIVSTRLLQSQQIIGANCLRLLENSRIRHFVTDAISCEILLENGITIMSMPCSSTAARGLAICTLLLDECGWFMREGPKMDQEIFRALRPRMSQFRGAKFLAISTPSSKQGLLYDLFEEGMDRDRPTPGRLTVHGETILINPTVDPDFLASEKRRDIDNYSREFQAEFAESVSTFFPSDKLLECFRLPGDVKYENRYRYYGAIDQSGLSGRDRFAFAIAHRVGDEIVLDVLRDWSTKSGATIIAEIKEICKTYNVPSVAVDRYAGGWVREAFERQGLEVTVRDLLPPIYINLKSLIISGSVLLPDNRGLREGLLRTNAFYGRSNQLSIGHERSSEGHGDESDASATAIWLASSQRQGGYFAEALEQMEKRLLQEKTNETI